MSRINLWYAIKKLGYMQIDKDCELCIQSLKHFKKRPMNANDVMLIIPNVNTFGIITHYHIGRSTRDKVGLKVKIIQDTEKP